MTTNHDDLVTALRRSARDLVERHSIRDLHQTLADIVQSAVRTVPHVEAGGVSVTEDGQVVSRHPTTDAVTRLDEAQSEFREGPCFTTATDPPENGILVVDDFAGDEARRRWPRFAPLAVDAGYRAIMSTELTCGPRMRAALNLYASQPHAFDADARVTAGLFGVQAAMLLYGSEQADYLQRAVDSRDLIGQAKGILMERFRISDDEAFHMLIDSSQDTNLKLVEVARWLRDETNTRSARSATEADG